MDGVSFVLPAATAALVASATCCLCLGAFRRWLVDVPNERSSHRYPIPRGGGVGVMTGALAGFLVGVPTGDVAAVGGLTMALALSLGLLGLRDDFAPLAISVRLPLTFGASAILVAASSLPLSPAGAGAALLAVCAMTSYVNAFNFMDGINGISTLTGVVAALAYVSFAWLGDHDPTVLLLGTVTAAGLIGFAPFNVVRCRLFLGDAGSYGIGFLLAACAYLVYRDGVSPLDAIAPLLIYFADTGVTLIRRALRRQRLGEPHRDHVYQAIVDGGVPHLHAAIFVAVLTGVLSAMAWLEDQVGLPLQVVLVLGYLTAPRWAGGFRRRV